MNGEAAQDVKFFDLSSRIGRMRYLAYGLGLLLLVIVPGLLAAGLMAVSPGVGSLLLFVVYVGALVFNVGFMVRRLHDMDNSGWWALLILLPLVNLILTLVLIFYPGTDGENRFGPQPPPNTTWVLVGAWCYIILIPIGTVGILAAIAIPAYQDYLARAQTIEAMQLANNAEGPVVQYYQNNKAWPTDLAPLYGGPEHRGPVGKFVDTVKPVTASDGSFGIVATMRETGVGSRIAGRSLVVWTSDGGASWHCGPAADNGLDPIVLPLSCREVNSPSF